MSRRPEVLVLLIGLLAIVGCVIDNLTGPTSVSLGVTATYSMRLLPNTGGASGLSRTPVVAMDVPIGWTLTSNSYTGAANGVPVSGSGTVVANSTGCNFSPATSAGYQRIFLSTATILLAASDSATLSVTFLVGGAPGNNTLSFWLGAQEGGQFACQGPPTTIAVAVTSPVGLYFPLPPCRVLDTRNPTGPFGSPSLQPGGTRVFDPTASTCGIPFDAVAISANLTVTNVGAPGELVVFPSDILQPNTNALSFRAGRTRANNAIVKLSNPGTTFSVVNNSPATVDFILDVNGYFQ